MSKVRLAKRYVKSTCAIGGVAGVVIGFMFEMRLQEDCLRKIAANGEPTPDLFMLSPLMEPLVRRRRLHGPAWTLAGFSVFGAVSGPVLVPWLCYGMVIAGAVQQRRSGQHR